MKKNNINSLQIGALVVSIITAVIMGLGILNASVIARVDAYIATIISTILGFIPIILMLYIANFKPNLNIKEKINNLFGKKIGFIINLIITIIIAIIAITTLFSVVNFIVSQFLSNTPIIYIAAFFGILTIYALTKGIETISRSSLILITISMVLFIFFTLCLTNEFEIDNLKPFLEFGIERPLIGGFTTMLMVSIPIFTILMIPKNNIIDKKNYNKAIIISYIIGAVTIIIISTLTIGILGQYLSDIYQYPEYIVLKKIKLFDFIDRIENIVCIHWIISTFITICMCSYYITNTIKKNDKPKKLAILIVSLIVILSIYVFKNNTAFNMYIVHIYPYILSVLLLLIIIISIAIKFKKNKINH